VAWTLPGSSSPGESTPAAIYVSDRGFAADASTLQTVDLGEVSVTADKVALSPDRLRLVAIRADRQAFVEFTRSTVGARFGSPSTSPFANINAAVGTTGDSLGAPTMAPDDLTLFYTRGQAVLESHRSVRGDWSVGDVVHIAYTLGAGQSLRPSAVSKDLLTLFFWDDNRSLESGAWRLDTTASFDLVLPVGAFPNAQPDESCQTFFFASKGTDGETYLASAVPQWNP